MIRRLAALLLGTLFALCALPALAQTAPSVTASLNIAWTNATTDSTGAALTTTTAVSSVEVFASTTPIPATTAPSSLTPLATLTTAATTATETFSVPAGATVYVYAADCNVFGCGPLSAAGSAVAKGPTPGAPTNVTVTITLT